MFTLAGRPQPQALTLHTWRNTQEGQRAHAQAQVFLEQYLSFAERGSLARAQRLTYTEKLFQALAEVSTGGDQLVQTSEVQEVHAVAAYLQEAVRIIAADTAIYAAALAVYAAYQEDADAASAPAAAERRHAALLHAQRSDAHQRPLCEIIRLFKILALPPAAWSAPRLQALPLIWSRQGVQPQRAWEGLIALMVISWLAMPVPSSAFIATAIDRLAEAAPAVHAEVLAKAERAHKASHEAYLATHGLAPEAIFTLLGTPVGPIRGHVMANIRQLLQNPEDPTIDFGPHTATLRERARAAHNGATV
jgi:hypothetical protein